MTNGLEQQKLRELAFRDYEAYLQTPWWRRRRNRALQLAGWTCTRDGCGNKTELQVHHRTYANVGAEQDDDLEVLCRACHEGHHFDESRRAHLGIYVRLVSAAVKARPYASFADLGDDVKRQCLAHRIPYDGPRVNDAINLVDANRRGITEARRRLAVAAPRESAPIGKAEAAAICKRFGIVVPFRSFPRASWTDDGAYRRQLEAAHALDVEVY